MADHMTAEQLRAEITAKCAEFMGRAIDAQNAPGWTADESARDAYVAAVQYLRTIAARLSGMAAVPEGYALVPIRATDEMIQSFHRGALNAAPDGDYHGKPTVSANAMYRAGYAALLFAAPEPTHV